MLAFGMKMDEQALEPGSDEIQGKTWNLSPYLGARHDPIYKNQNNQTQNFRPTIKVLYSQTPPQLFN